MHCDREGIRWLVESFGVLADKGLQFGKSTSVIAVEACVQVSSIAAVPAVIKACLAGEIFPIRVSCKGEGRRLAAEARVSEHPTHWGDEQ